MFEETVDKFLWERLGRQTLTSCNGKCRTCKRVAWRNPRESVEVAVGNLRVAREHVGAEVANRGRREVGGEALRVSNTTKLLNKTCCKPPVLFMSLQLVCCD